MPTLPTPGQDPWDAALNDVLAEVSNQWLPSDYGLAGWSYDPALCDNAVTVVNGTLYLNRVNIRRNVTVDNLAWMITTVGAAPVAGQNWVGLYTAAGSRIAQANVDAQVTVTGFKATAVAAVALTPGLYWVATLFNAGTPPQLLSGVDSTVRPNLALANAVLRSAVNGTALTALPASITPASNTATGGKPQFVGVGL